jgi:diamine N-acetyltransferase
MKHSYLTTDRIRLRAMEPEDLELIFRLENEPDLWSISNFTVPYSRYAVKRYLEETRNDLFADQELRLVIVRRAEGATSIRTDNEITIGTANESIVGTGSEVSIGTIDIIDFSPLHKRGEVGIVLSREYRGAGYATEALRLLCDYAFDYLCLKQLVAHILVENSASLRLFTSCGFTQCGILREWLFVEGAYHDVALLQRITP